MAPFLEELRPHYSDAARYCRLLCSTWQSADAEDVFQQALLHAFEHYGELRDHERFRAWLFRIVFRTFLMTNRRRSSRPSIALESAHEEPSAPAVYRNLRHDEQTHLLMAALALLKPKERATVLLFEVAGFSVAEIAAIQGERSASAVKSRLSRARKQLRRVVTAQAAEAAAKAPRPKDESTGIEYEALRLVAEVEQRGLLD